jgi:hypothetical protein
MKIVEQKILTADKGMYLTDGEDYVENVVLPADVDHSAWREVPEAELPKVEFTIEE